MTTESSQRPVTAGATVYLMEELGDARLRCDQLVRYTSEASKLIENSTHRDHFFEVAGHLIQSIPETLFKLQKALQAVALAATRMDYEEIKQELRPEKVDQLERVLQDVRIRHVNRRSDPWTPEQAAKTLRGMVAAIRESGLLPRTEMIGLILDLEFGVRKADNPDVAASLEAIATSLEKADEPPSQLRLATMLRRILDDDLLKIPQEPATMDRSADWKTNEARTAAEPGEAPPFGEAMVSEGLEKALTSLRKAMTAQQAGNSKKMFFGLLGVLDGLGMVGRAHDLPDVGYLMRVWKAFASMSGARPSTNFSASDDEKESRFEEGKPADPTENMSPEDAEKWKTEHAKNKDKFKAAAVKTKANFDKLQHEMRAHLDTFDMAWSRYEKDPEKNKGKLDDALRYMTALQDVAGVLIRNMKELKGGKTASWKTACDDDKQSRFEEGKPADPTQNMSPEDAKRWKEEHDKNKDKFKEAAALSERVQLEFNTAALSMRNAGKGQQPKKNAIIAVRSIATALSMMGEDRAYDVLWRAADTMQTSGMWDMYEKKAGGGDEKESRFEEGKPADPTENMSPEDARRWKEEHDKNKDKFKSAVFGGLPINNLTKFPSGKWGFVGKVDARLSWVAKDGSELTPEQAKEVARANNPAMLAKSRAFSSPLEALQEAKRLRQAVTISPGDADNEVVQKAVKQSGHPHVIQQGDKTAAWKVDANYLYDPAYTTHPDWSQNIRDIYKHEDKARKSLMDLSNAVGGLQDEEREVQRTQPMLAQHLKEMWVALNGARLKGQQAVQEFNTTIKRFHGPNDE